MPRHTNTMTSSKVIKHRTPPAIPSCKYTLWHDCWKEKDEGFCQSGSERVSLDVGHRTATLPRFWTSVDQLHLVCPVLSGCLHSSDILPSDTRTQHSSINTLNYRRLHVSVCLFIYCTVCEAARVSFAQVYRQLYSVSLARTRRWNLGWKPSHTATSQHTSSISTSSTTTPPVVVLPWTQKHSRMMCLARLPGNTGRAVLLDSQNK